MVPVFAVFLFWVSEGRGRLEMLLEGPLQNFNNYSAACCSAW